MLSNQQKCGSCQDVKRSVQVIWKYNGTAYLKDADLSTPFDIHYDSLEQGSGRQIRNSSNPVESLSIMNCTIPVLNNEILKHFPNLKTLNCMDNTIDEISEDAFEASKGIGRIVFENCKIKRIAENAFNTNQALGTIELRNNLIQELPKKIFYHLINLTRLDLTGNKLNEIDEDIFKHLYKLCQLYVNDNNLLKLNLEKVFNYSPMLHTIGLNGNNFCFDDLLKMIKLKNKLRKSFGSTAKPKERKRDHPILLIEGVECVDEETFAQLVAERKLKQANEQLVRDFGSALNFDGDNRN